LLYRALAVTLSTLAVLPCGELAISQLDSRASYEAWREASLSYLLDDVTDWKLEPRRYAWGQVNRAFFRGPEVSPTKPPGVYRIIVLGGSAAFDMYKRDEETWAARLERLLDGQWGKRVEVINAGTPGFSTWQARRFLQHKLIRYQPDLVLLYELYNDSLMFRFEDRSKMLHAWKVNALGNYVCAAAHPHAGWDAAGYVLPATVDFVRMLWIARAKRRAMDAVAQHLHRAKLDAHATPAGLGFYAENVESMAAFLEARGVSFGVVTQASLIRERNLREHLPRIDYRYRGLDHDALWSAYQRAWRLPKPIVDRHANAFLIPAHLGIPADFRFFLDEVHLTYAGSELLASIVAQGVRKRLGPKPAPGP
jgi:lysophospholipase L1-like esterase